MEEREFQEIYQRHYLKVMKVAVDILHDYHMAQDVCQEVFFKLCQKWDEVEKEMMGEWLVLYAQWRAIDCWRKNHRQWEMQTLEATYTIPGRTNLEKEVERREFQKTLFWELEKKNPDWCELVVRLIFGNENPKDLAAEKGITVSSLRKKLCRARAWIRQTFGDDFPEF